MSGAQASIKARLLHSTRRVGLDYRRAMFSSIPLAGRAPGARESQGGGAPPGDCGPPGPPPPPRGYGPPGAPPAGGHGPPGAGGYGPPTPPFKPITGSAATMAMHALTIDPRTGLPRGEKAPASIAAVVALVCGILLCLGPFTGVPAIIAGVLGRKAAREFPQTVGGKGMATAGLVLGALNITLSLLVVSALALWHF